MSADQSFLSRRQLLAAVPVAALAVRGAVAPAAEPATVSPATGSPATVSDAAVAAAVAIPAGKRILLSCKLGMIPGETAGTRLPLAARLALAKEAGFDGVDLDQAALYTPAEARAAVAESGVFVHNAINHAHWQTRLTSADAAERERAVANLEHCLRVAHAAGGSGVLIVIGQGGDGPAAEIEERCRNEMKKVLPLAAALGQPILIENVWNRMMYDHDAPPEQGPERFIAFVDSFKSPWVGMYYDVGNHWKYGQPAAWIRAFGHRCVKLDIKGFSRKKNAFVDIVSADDDVPWGEVRQALAEIGFSGWATAEVGGGDVARLTTVRKQMEQALLG
jgi:hexulose-6-phosphate isomerase